MVNGKNTKIESYKFQFHSCTIVQNFTTFWIRIPSPAITVVRPEPTGPPVTQGPAVAPGDINYQLVKAHGNLIEYISSLAAMQLHRLFRITLHAGSMMTIAWALFAPVGILLALFYKVVWPNGEWFYVSSSDLHGCSSHVALSPTQIYLYYSRLI